MAKVFSAYADRVRCPFCGYEISTNTIGQYTPHDPRSGEMILADDRREKRPVCVMSGKPVDYDYGTVRA